MQTSVRHKLLTTISLESIRRTSEIVQRRMPHLADTEPACEANDGDAAGDQDDPQQPDADPAGRQPSRPRRPRSPAPSAPDGAPEQQQMTVLSSNTGRQITLTEPARNEMLQHYNAGAATDEGAATPWRQRLHAAQPTEPDPLVQCRPKRKAHKPAQYCDGASSDGKTKQTTRTVARSHLCLMAQISKKYRH